VPNEPGFIVEEHGPGYHVTKISKGVIGELSKIQEELDELKDAELQNCSVMQLVELSDLIGAIDAYMEHRFPRITIHDLEMFANITKRAFVNGHRK
jgi:hypothetical protein